VANSSPRGLTDVGGTLFLAAHEPTHGQELWKSDGTRAGTRLVRDINPGTGNSHPYYLTDVGGSLFFRADDGTHGVELWNSDGSRAGTQVAARNLDSTLLYSQAVAGGALYFAGHDVMHGVELWKVLPPE
jgi:ELWxxDGT repeat protein